MPRRRWKRIPKQLPQTINELVAAGGPTAFARAAAETAARQTFEFWLDVLERINQDDLDEQDQMFCALYIRSLRRKLGVPKSKEETREQTRLRVRRFRERRAHDQLK
jgi:hypothetical protein